jgi:hypothetical protein
MAMANAILEFVFQTGIVTISIAKSMHQKAQNKRIWIENFSNGFRDPFALKKDAIRKSATKEARH